MLLKELTAFILEALLPLYDEREAQAIVNRYVQDKMGLPKHELALRRDDEVESFVTESVFVDAKLLSAGVPVQYVVGKEEFCGLNFKVSNDVLIPRPETEELVYNIVEECKNLKNKVTIWDVGTGSGCIAVSLSKLLPAATVFATDISESALQTAAENAKLNGADVHFALHDMLQKSSPFGEMKFDVIVSNPPYIPASDRELMHVNVSENEPEIALFVPDNDKFIFYKALSDIACKFLKESGTMYVETYNRFHDELKELFLASGLKKVVSLTDFFGRDRFMRMSRFQ